MSNPALRFQIRGESSETLELDIYDDIGRSFWGDGVTAQAVRRALKNASKAKTIKLRVNSRGGDVFEGFAIYNLLVEHQARVEADVDALAASMASVILMAADEIRVAQGAMIMIHNPIALAFGEADDLRGTADLLDKVRGQIADAYVARTGQPKDRVLAMMDAETWMTPEEAKAEGFADEVKPAKGESQAKALAALDLSGLRHTPALFAAAVACARSRPAASPPPVPAPAPAPAPATTDNRVELAVEPAARPDQSKAASGREETEMGEKMDLRTLQTQHPDVYEAALAAGVAQERDRVCAHLELGEKSGDLQTAFGAIRDGSGMTQTLTAKYLTAGMNRSDRAARQADSDTAGAAVEGAKPDEGPTDLGAQVADILEARRGKKAAG